MCMEREKETTMKDVASRIKNEYSKEIDFKRQIIVLKSF